MWHSKRTGDRLVCANILKPLDGALEATMHTIYFYVNEKLPKITDLVERIMVSTPEWTQSVRWGLRQSDDFGKSKIVKKLQTAAIFVYIYVRERAVENEKKTLWYDT